MKKLLSVLIVTVMLLGMIPFALTATAATNSIALGQTVTVNADRTNPEALFTYTAAEEGEYVFYATSDEEVDTFGYILDKNGEIIANDDDGNTNMDFLCTTFLEKGETVTLRSRLYNIARKATYTVTFAKRGEATAIVTDKEEYVVYSYNTFRMEYGFAPVGSFDEYVKITSSNPEVAIFNEDIGEFFAYGPGTATFTLATESGLTKTVKVTVKDPDALTLGKEVSGVSEGNYGYYRYNFTPAKDGIYTFDIKSNGHFYTYATTSDSHFSGGEGDAVAFPVFMTAGETYTLHINTYSTRQNYTVLVREPINPTDIYIDGGDSVQYVGFQDWLYAYGDGGEIAGEVEWSVDDPTVADIYKDSSSSATIIIRKPGIVTVTAKYGDLETSTVIMGVDIHEIKVGTPYSEQTVGMQEVVVKFTPEQSGVYRVKSTDEIGEFTYVEISNYNQGENYVDQYMEAGVSYTLRASRFFMGIGMGFDENDYVGDVTIEVNKLESATGIKTSCGDTLTAYKNVEFEIFAAPSNENGAFYDGPSWILDTEDKGEINYIFADRAGLIFYEEGEYKLTIKADEFEKVVNIKVVAAEKVVVGKEYKFTVPANSMYALEFCPEKTGFYTAVVKSDAEVSGTFGEYGYNGKDVAQAATFVSGENRGVTVYNDNNKPANVTLVVRDTIFPTSMKPDAPSITLSVGEFYYPTMSFTPDEAREELAGGTSSNEKVAKVDDWGQIRAVGVGTATVTLVSDYGLKTTVTVVVVDHNYVWATDLNIKENEITLDAGKSQTLTAEVEAEGKKTVAWMSLDDSVARVDANGRVTGVAAGETYIVASVDALRATCKVTVKAPKIEDTSKVFSDVKAGKWYTKAIDYAYSYGFIAGTSANEFGRETNVNRGMFITILARIAGVDTGKTANKTTTKFTDVKSGKYYTAAIKWANENGVVSGTGDKTFSPEASISRQDLCVMVTNFAKYMNINVSASKDELKFKDASSISKYAKNAVKACQMAGIVNGYNDGTFGPKKTATRAEAAQILYVFHNTFVAK